MTVDLSTAVSLEKPEPDVALTFFQELAQQEDNFYEAEALFAGVDAEKEAVLNDIASLALQFTVARIFRYRETRGEPRSIRFRIEVEVDGDEKVTESGLHVGTVEIP